MTKLYSYAITVFVVVGAIALVAFAFDATPTPAAAECTGGTATPTATATGTATATMTATATTTATATATATESPTATTTLTNALTGISAGNLPPATGGFGTFAFCGGTWDELLITSQCPEASAVFFYNKPDGTFAVWIPGSDVAIVNAELLGLFPGVIPGGTIFTARCV